MYYSDPSPGCSTPGCSVWSGFEQLSSRQLRPSSLRRSDLAALHTWSQTAALHTGIFHFLFSLAASPLTLNLPPTYTTAKAIHTSVLPQVANFRYQHFTHTHTHTRTHKHTPSPVQKNARLPLGQKRPISYKIFRPYHFRQFSIIYLFIYLKIATSFMCLQAAVVISISATKSIYSLLSAILACAGR